MKTSWDNEKLTIGLEGRIDSGNAAAVENEISEAIKEKSPSVLVLDAEGLDYISSAGLRALFGAAEVMQENGDMCVIMPNGSDKSFRMKMCAQLAHSQWLKDVDYWKQSCPPGSRIRDWNQNAFCFSDGKTSFYFGVSPDKQFYSGGSEEDALMIYSLKVVESEETGIETVTNVFDATAPVYDLNGRRVKSENLKPGVYVRQGKKMVVK